ncbi:kelch-like protein 10 [Galendromus occidentalis]|uniref:Kelch-like protein 10 n=1 Tax=Galendromus occidentalis TaxID=34638 RepID=A0AAJ6QP57_9ACAR|nr:kelch-like protein 10 [Galendromus occidentalis]
MSDNDEAQNFIPSPKRYRMSSTPEEASRLHHDLEDVLLYTSKLIIKDRTTGDEEVLDVYDGALRAFTGADAHLEVSRKDDGRGEKFVIKPPPELTKRALKTLISYIHQGLSKGNPLFTIDELNVEDLFDASAYLECRQATEACVEFWLKRVTPYTCVDLLLDIGLRKNVEVVRDKSFEILRRFFSSVIPENKRYLDLPPDILNQTILADDLDAPDERLVFETLVEWVNHDRNKRLAHAKNLLGGVRFMFCGETYLRETVLPHPLLSEAGCQVIAEEISLHMTRLERQPTSFMDPKEYMLRPRVSRATVFAIGGWSNGQASALVEAYDNRAKRWFPISHDNDVQPRAYHGLVPIGSRIFMIGGFDGTNCFNDVRCYDSAAHEWIEKAPMHRERCYVSTAALDDKFIYALGGYDGTSRTNTAERYDVEQNTWTMIPPMNAVRSDACASALNGKIFIVGGFTGDGVLPSVEFFDPQTNVWTAVRSMMSPRSGVRCVAHQGRLIVLGGYNGRERLNSVERYDDRRDRWERLPDMPTVRSNFGIVSFEGRVYAIGGFNGQTTVAQVDALDPEQSQWMTIQGMTINRSALGACVCETADPKYFSMLSKDSASPSGLIAPKTLGRTH